MTTDLSHLLAALKELDAEIEQQPLPVKVAIALGFNYWSEQDLKRAFITWKVNSLDAQVGSEDDKGGIQTLLNVLPGGDADEVESLVEKRDLKDRLEALLNRLEPRDRKILRLRFGLEDGVRHTLDSVGKKFGVTRERIRQLENRALETLRSFPETDSLKDYW